MSDGDTISNNLQVKKYWNNLAICLGGKKGYVETEKLLAERGTSN